MTCTADFEKGVNGVSISAGDPGSATAWDAVGLGGAGSLLQYDNAHVAHGTLAAKSHNQTSGSTNLVWQTAFGTLTEHWGRAYLFCTTFPSTTIIAPVDTGTAEAGIAWNGFGSFTVNGINSNAFIPLSTWARLEWHYFHDAAGFVVVKTFLDQDSITADDIKLFSFNTGVQATELDFGNRGNGGAVFTLWYDQCVAAAPSFPGPFPVSTIAPTVAGSSPVGSTLFCDGGTWNGGAQFTLAYQWTRNSVTIPAANGSTYTTQSNDSSQQVGCTVTATGLVATNESAAINSSNTILVSSSTQVSVPHFSGRFHL